MAWKNGQWARSLRQRQAVSATRGQKIDNENRGKNERQVGIKQRVIMCYRGMGKDEAKKLFDELNKTGYPKEKFEEWIMESDFQHDVQQAYIKKGKDEALQLFENRNATEFNGRFSKGTFLNWLNEADRTKCKEGR